MTNDANIETRIRKILTEQLSTALPSCREAVLMDAISTWDSMAQVQIVVALEADFNIEADADLLQAQSLVSLVDIIRARLKTRSVTSA